jgi:cholesterol oxidase
MTGCRYNSKNTLDKNYLHLAEAQGLDVMTETKVVQIRTDSNGGYLVTTRASYGSDTREITHRAAKVIIAAGVLGTTKLLLEMKRDTKGFPNLSSHTGKMVRTNNESLIGITTEDRDGDCTNGIAISSIVHTDDHSHVEPVRYGPGSGFFRTMGLPHAGGRSMATRIFRVLRFCIRHPLKVLKAFTVPDWARYTTILLYMRSLEETLSFDLSRSGSLKSQFSGTNPPRASIPEATDIALRYAEKVNGTAMSIFAETLFNIPTTAHILGGACMSPDASGGVIGPDHQVHGYPGLFVCDGSTVSANPGVNPSLTITAMAERAMSLIPPKNAS